MKTWVIKGTNEYCFCKLTADEFGIAIESSRDLENATKFDRKTVKQVYRLLMSIKELKKEKLKIFKAGD